MKRPLLWVVLAALAFTAAGIVFSRHSTFVIDGNLYFEIARQVATRHTLGIPNGLDVTESTELALLGCFRHGLDQFPLVAPLYGLFAAPFYALFGVRGLSMLNAVALGALVLGFFLVARRILGDRAAALASVAMPFSTLLLAHSFFELPHVLAAALLMWAVHFADRAIEDSAPRAAFLHAAAGGLLVGLGTGVRLQLALPALVLAAVGWLHARQKRAVAAGLAAPFGLCILMLSLINRQRFGTFNPISYGMSGTVSSTYYLTDPGLLHLGTLVLLAALALRRLPEMIPHRNWLRAGAAGLALLLVVTSSSLRTTLSGVITSTRMLFFDASVDLHSANLMLGWMVKSMLECSPFLALGLVGMVLYGKASAPRLVRGAAWICLVTIAFLVVRMPANGDYTMVLGGLVFSPRYLGEIEPFLFLIGCWMVRDLVLDPRALSAGVVVGVGSLWFLWKHGPTDVEPLKQGLLIFGGLGLALALAVVWGLHQRGRALGPSLAWLVAVTIAHGAAVGIAEDSRLEVSAKTTHQTIIERIRQLVPKKLVLVGYDGSMDGVFALRATNDAIMVNTWFDGGLAVVPTLKPFSAADIPVYYYGAGLEQLGGLLWGSYTAVQLDPAVPLWRLDPVKP